MDSIFKISKYSKYGILVEGLEYDNGEYIPEDGTRSSIRKYKFTDSVSINTLSSVASNGAKTFISYEINTHNSGTTDSTSFDLSKDGLYLISHIILPNKGWFDYMVETYPLELEKYNLIYYFDSEKFYKADSTEVTINEILEADYEWSGEFNEKTTTVVRSDKNTFILYFLNECFAKICKGLLSTLSRLECLDQNKYKALIFNRDLIWMGINTIKYNIETLQLFEAQRILEQISWCSSMCDNAKPLNTFNTCGCNN